MLKIKNLSIGFQGASGGPVVPAVQDLSLLIAAGETVALVGESGSGKSVTGYSVLQLLRDTTARYGDDSRIEFEGQELISASDAQMRAIRGNDISMIFQEPMTALNPLHRIGRQIAESLILHQQLAKPVALNRAVELLEQVGIRDAAGRVNSYPHELSGGQRQRVMIAMALANRPKLLVADEPTTALDVTIQAQILELLAEQRRAMNMGMLLITHDLGIVRAYADRTYVLEKGILVEQGKTQALFDSPQHPYTRKLLDAVPAGRPAPVPADAAVVADVDDLKVYFPVKSSILQRTLGQIKAVDGVSFQLRRGETVGVVGESGSGKSSLGYALLALVPRTGKAVLLGKDLTGLGKRELKALRADAQIVFQDPFGSLNPRMTVGDIIGEGLEVHRPKLSADERDDIIVQIMQEVELDPGARFRYPHEFSGGQRQRISVARALVLEPEFLVLDEPTSALDRTVQLQVINLLRRIQEKRNLAYLFISHDLEVVRAMSHRIIVMKDGQVVETGEADALCDDPQHVYTKALMAAAFDLRIPDAVADVVEDV